MNDNLSKSNLGAPKEEYEQRFFSHIFRTIELQFDNLLSVGPIRISTLNVSDIPTSATGLKAGDVWSNSGVLTIV